MTGANGIKGCGSPPMTGVPCIWGENEGTEGEVLPGATSGAPTGYAPVVVVAGDTAGRVLNGFMAGGAAGLLRFKFTIPNSRPAVWLGDADVETATRGTDVGGVVGPTRGT